MVSAAFDQPGGSEAGINVPVLRHEQLDFSRLCRQRAMHRSSETVGPQVSFEQFEGQRVSLDGDDVAVCSDQSSGLYGEVADVCPAVNKGIAGPQGELQKGPHVRLVAFDIGP